MLSTSSHKRSWLPGDGGDCGSIGLNWEEEGRGERASDLEEEENEEEKEEDKSLLSIFDTHFILYEGQDKQPFAQYVNL